MIFVLSNKIANIKQKYYDRLYLMDNFRVVSDLVFSDDVTLFGPVVTYFDLAFRDMIEEIHLKKS